MEEFESCAAEHLPLEEMIRLTWPSTTPEFQGSVHDEIDSRAAYASTASGPEPESEQQVFTVSGGTIAARGMEQGQAFF